MDSKIFKNYQFLETLCKTKSINKRNQLIENASPEELLCVVEICLNLLKTYNLSPKQKRKLIPYADYVRKLSRAKTERSARQIIQKGSGPVLAAILAPIISEISRVLISKFSTNE